MADYEYEYIPPNEGSRPEFKSDLESVYDVTTTPAGMRGEAVRSAIRSGRCICWNLDASPLGQGWISVKGKGTLDFLNNKFTQTFSSGGVYQEACLLNAKGRVVDKIGVVVLSDEHAYMLTSPGHSGSDLFDRLDPLIFPMDQVKLQDCSKTSKIITLASTKQEHAETAIESYVVPLLDLKDSSWEFPTQSASQVTLTSGATLTIVPTSVLPETATSGYTLVMENDDDDLGQALWRNLIGEESPDGPIEIGALEFETLRIEGGMPLFGKELTVALGDDATILPAGPLELHWDNLVDQEKGCYLGQEGVASVVKNPRGPPRLLYQVVFDYDDNVFDTETEGDRRSAAFENLTKLPQAGLEIFVLGSQNEISVGTLTSVAEPSGTGDNNMLALALCRRGDSILKAMKKRDLEIDRNLGKEPFADEPLWNDDNVDAASAMVPPPPMDPLDGVEVVVKDMYTVGVLRSIPSRRYPMGQNMFTDIVTYDGVEPGEGEIEVNRIKKKWAPEVDAALDEVFAKQQQQRQQKQASASTSVDIEETDLMDEASQAEIDRAAKEASKAQAEADAAAAEAQRKADKMEMLKKRAEEAMAKRKAKKAEVAAPISEATNPDDEAAEEQRKAEKMATLKKRAEEAMARRKLKKQQE